MEILNSKVTLDYIRNLAQNWYGDMIKAVADVEKGYFPDLDGEDFVEFDSLINIRPRQNNKSRDVEDPQIRERIISIVNQFIVK